MFYLAGVSKAEFNPDFSTSPHSSTYVAAFLFTSPDEAREGIDQHFSGPTTYESLTEWQEHPERKGHFIKQFNGFNQMWITGKFWVRLFPAPINQHDKFIIDWHFDADNPTA